MQARHPVMPIATPQQAPQEYFLGVKCTDGSMLLGQLLGGMSHLWYR